jgi:hypothetical protein
MVEIPEPINLLMGEYFGASMAAISNGEKLSISDFLSNINFSSDFESFLEFKGHTLSGSEYYVRIEKTLLLIN